MNPRSKARRKLITVLVALSLVGILDVAIAATDDAFTLECKLPWAAVAPKRDANRSCPAEGKADKAPHQAQNRAKNDLCATGTPVTITWDTFKALQKKAEDDGVSFGSANKLPDDRKVLRNIYKLPNGKRIGEGSIVTYVGFISHPRYSNTGKGKGESVNCKLPDRENNDIHVDLVKRPGDPACRSVTAEIIPHFRPLAWEVDKLKLVMDRPVRITGHLFFDAAHRPCKNDDDKVAPKRISLWEIHPVYAVDVCREKTVTACPADSKTKWLPLDQWVNVEEDND
jgi:hypothetical protein